MRALRLLTPAQKPPVGVLRLDLGNELVAGLVLAAPMNEMGLWSLFDHAGGQIATNVGSTKTPWKSSERGAYLAFDGSTQVMKFNRSTGPDNFTGKGFTLAILARSAGPGTFEYLFSKGDDASARYGYSMYTGSSNGLLTWYGFGTDLALSGDAGNSMWDGKWHWLVGRLLRGRLSLFVDGLENAASVVTGLTSSIAQEPFPVTIGCYGDLASTEVFTGDIGGAFVWNRGLEDTEVRRFVEAPYQVFAPSPLDAWSVPVGAPVWHPFGPQRYVLV